MSFRHRAPGRYRVKEGSGLSGEPCVTVARLCLANGPLTLPNFSYLKTIHFFQAFFSYAFFFPLCTYNNLKQYLHYTPHSGAGAEAEGLFGFQDKILEQRKSDPGCFFFLWVPSLRKAFPRYFPPPESQWKPRSSAALWNIRYYWGEGWPAPIAWVEMRWGDTALSSGASYAGTGGAGSQVDAGLLLPEPTLLQAARGHCPHCLPGPGLSNQGPANPLLLWKVGHTWFPWEITDSGA